MGSTPESPEMVVVNASDIEYLRSQLPEDLKAACGDDTLSRFIRATGGDLKNVRFMLGAFHLVIVVASIRPKKCLQLSVSPLTS